MLEQIRLVAEPAGVTLCERVRQAVADALTRREHGGGEETIIARELERLARKLRHSG